jgi:hypothetical protein
MHGSVILKQYIISIWSKGCENYIQPSDFNIGF